MVFRIEWHGLVSLSVFGSVGKVLAIRYVVGGRERKSFRERGLRLGASLARWNMDGGVRLPAVRVAPFFHVHRSGKGDIVYVQSIGMKYPPWVVMSPLRFFHRISPESKLNFRRSNGMDLTYDFAVNSCICRFMFSSFRMFFERVPGFAARVWRAPIKQLS